MLGRKRSMKLATKLVAALLVPLVAVGVLAAILVDSFSSEADQAESELLDVRTSIAMSQLGLAIRDELSAIAFLPLADVSTELNQQITDAAFEEALAVAGDQVTTIRTFRGRIDTSREIIGDNPAIIRRGLGAELLSGEKNGIVTQQIDLYREASAVFLRAATFDSPENLSGVAATSLSTVQLLSNYNAAIQAEYDAFQAFSRISASTVDRQVQTLAQEVRLATVNSEAALSAIFAVGSAELRTELSNLRNTEAFTETLELRRLVTAEIAGPAPSAAVLRERAPEISTSRLTSSIWAVSSSLDIIRFQAITSLEEGAEARRNSARLALQTTVTFAALLTLAVIIIGFFLYQSIRRPIRNLTEQSRRIASHELPEVVSLIREQGIDAELPTIQPIEAEANDEIGALVTAFNQMHITAVQLAGEQASARATVADMFVNLGRRNQKLLLRLLNHMDSLERKATNADVLEELFKVDHLATRMRRNAESLLVLAGARSTRHFDRPLPLSALLRASLSEVDGYERVHLNIADDILIDASAIADISHLVAELVENAITFSPRSSRVEIAARLGDDSLLLAIADQGKGMTTEELEAANRRIADAAKNTETPSRFLGHYVSGRLVARHNLELVLIPGMPAGLICRLRIPNSLLINDLTVRPRIDGPLAAQVATHHRDEEIEGTRRADLTTNPFLPPAATQIPTESGKPDVAMASIAEAGPAPLKPPSAPELTHSEVHSEVPSEIVPVAESVGAIEAAPIDHAASTPAADVTASPDEEPEETPSHASFAGVQAASAHANPAKSRHGVLGEDGQEPPLTPEAEQTGKLRSRILPGSAPVTVTTDGPTQGALAGARRRVPTAKRDLPSVDVKPHIVTPLTTVSQVPVPVPVPVQDAGGTPPLAGGLVTSGRRQPGANMPKGLEPRVVAKSETDHATSMDEALTLTRSADAVRSSFSGLQAAFQRAEENNPSERLEDLTESAEGIL